MPAWQHSIQGRSKVILDGKATYKASRNFVVVNDIHDGCGQLLMEKIILSGKNSATQTVVAVPLTPALVYVVI